VSAPLSISWNSERYIQPDTLQPALRARLSVHFAVTADGKVSTVARTRAQFTSATDKQRLLEVRARHDAVMVAKGTLEKDRMSLGLRDEALRLDRIQRGLPEEPLRVIISGSGQLALDLPVFEYHGAPIVLYTTKRITDSTRAALEAKLAIHVMGEREIDLVEVLRHLFAVYQVRTIVCEGGPVLVKSFAQIDTIDEVFLTVAPKLFGGSLALTLTGLPDNFLPESRRFRLDDFEKGDNELYLTYQRDACIKPIRF
jgi:riboflavin-specific deaminase-like protein